MRTITLIAKGPSAEHCNEFIAEAFGTHIACINDAFRLVKSPIIDYVFFTHAQFMQAIARNRYWIQQAVCPDLLTHENIVPMPELADMLIQYPARQCVGDRESLLERIASGGICHHNTVNGALHWLAKHSKYDRIRLIGVDGGRSYAPGMSVLSQATHERIVDNEGTADYFDIWRQVTETLCELLTQVYGVEIEWYGR
jgi:hypothetical protein